MAKHKTKTGVCTACALPARLTQWANISGEYLRDLDDYREVCIPCHRRIDADAREERVARAAFAGAGIYDSFDAWYATYKALKGAPT